MIDGIHITVDGEGRLIVTASLTDIYRALDTAARAEFAEAICIEDEIVERVAAQLADGATEAGSWNGAALDRARLRIAEAAPTVAAEEVSRLARLLARRDEEIAALKLDMELLDDWLNPPDSYGFRRNLHNTLAKLREKHTASKATEEQGAAP